MSNRNNHTKIFRKRTMETSRIHIRHQQHYWQHNHKSTTGQLDQQCHRKHNMQLTTIRSTNIHHTFRTTNKSNEPNSIPIQTWIVINIRMPNSKQQFYQHNSNPKNKHICRLTTTPLHCIRLLSSRHTNQHNSTRKSWLYSNFWLQIQHFSPRNITKQT